MPEGLAHVAMRCEQCNKLFEKHSTLKRHGYYCRSRRLGRTVRSRSCIACARGKARCDNGQPSCSRCAAKDIQCRYPAKTSGNAASPTLAPSEQRRPSTNCAQDGPVSGDDVNMTFGSAPVTTTTPEVTWSDKQLLGWNERELGSPGQAIDWGDLTINFADFLNDQAIPAVVQYPEPSVDHGLNIQQVSSHKMSIPAVPDIYTMRSLVPRPARGPGQQRIANLVLHTLKSYPLMIMRHNALPPFIHPCSIMFHDGDESMETLDNCLSLMHMLGSKIHGSRKLFWRNVRWECERMRGQHARMNKWELLAAMQALSVYLLLRLQEGETEHNNYDSLMLTTVIIIAREFARTESGCDVESIISNPDIETSWKAWIFLESRRRLAVVYRVVNMLVYFEPANMCEMQKDLIIAPLPAKKQLWEAGDERVWDEVARRDNGIQESLALAADGELVQLDEGQSYCSQGALRYRALRGSFPTPKTTDWEDWCSGMDSFGNLIMLAASLIV